MAIIGKMDRRLTVQVRTLTRDATGAKVETWADSFQCWGELMKQSGNEGIIADADKAQTSAQFRIRYKSGLATGTHRVLYRLKFYDITDITEEGRSDRVVLTCRSVQALSI